MRIDSDAFLAFIIVIAIIAGVFLVVRGILLWYWRVNEQIDLLNKINHNLEQLNKKMNSPQVSVGTPSPVQTSNPSPTESSASISSNDIPEM